MNLMYCTGCAKPLPSDTTLCGQRDMDSKEMGPEELWFRNRFSRRVFLAAGLAGLAVAGCDLPGQKSPHPDFVAYHDKSSSYHQTQVDALSKRGYRLISLSLYDDPAHPLYAAVWIKRVGPAWHTFQRVSATEYQSLLDIWTKQGYRPVILSATGSGKNVVFAGVFEKDATPFIVKYDLGTNFHTDLSNLSPETDKGTIQYWSEWATNNNYILRWGTIYGNAAHPLYAGIWEKNTGNVAWNWDAGFYDTAGDYQNRVRAEGAQWARPAFITLAADGSAWSVFRDDQVGSRVVRNGLTSTEYKTQLDQLTAQGYYPLAVQGSGAGRFAAIFVKSEQVIARQWTVTGTAVPELSVFDDIIKMYMQNNGIRAGSLAIAKDGRLVFARAYTWAESGYPITQPTSLFRIASCNKPVTSIAVHQLIERGKLSLNTNVQEILRLRTPNGGPPIDPRFNNVQVWHLLSHLGGWDLNMSFDPLSYDAAITKALNVQLPVNKYQIASFMAGQPLQFDPGAKMVYSPFGYSLLGQVIEKVTGVSYTQAVKENILNPLGLRRPRPGRSLLANAAPGEVRYHGQAPYVEPSVITPDQPLVPYAYGGINIENRDSTGSTLMAAADYAKILAAFDLGDANPLLRPATVQMMWTVPTGVDTHAMARGWFKDTLGDGRFCVEHSGDFPGTATWIFSRRFDNISFVLFVNKDPLSQPVTLSPVLNDVANMVVTWPDIDLFPSVGIPAQPH